RLHPRPRPVGNERRRLGPASAGDGRTGGRKRERQRLRLRRRGAAGRHRVAFDAAVPAPDGKCSTNCPGLYSLIGGKVTRLSGAPGDCSSSGTVCGSEDIDPTVTSTGRVVYYSLFATSTFTCFYYCGSSGG